MSPRPPADAVVALRSLGRRYRGLFAGLGDDESPEDLAHRAGAEGRSACDHIDGARSTIAAGASVLEHVLVEDDPVLAVGAAGTPGQGAAARPGGTVEQQIVGLEDAAVRLAERAGRASARDWGRTGRHPDGSTVTAAEVLWDAVDAAVEHLRSAERVLREVRGRP